jgi:tetratricopeptide (TPR) repeat protein
MRMVRSISILVLLFWVVPILANAGPKQDSSSSFFLQANSEYQKGNYAAAGEIYARILESGMESGPLYYNLGNACFRQKKLGEAIYYWEKALQKSPADQETRENLELANGLTVDRQVQADPFPVRLLSGAMGFLTIAQEGWLAFSLFFATNILLAVFLVRNGRIASLALIGSFIIGILFVLSACSLAWKTYDRDFRKKGVVIEQKADVRSGPGIENITVFAIHEGLKVRVHGSSNGWTQISLPNGWTGWIRQREIRIL